MSENNHLRFSDTAAEINGAHQLEENRNDFILKRNRFFRRPRTAQEKILFCLTVFLIALSFFLILGLCLVSVSKTDESASKSEEDNDVCNTGICKKAAKWLTNAMNQSVDPCVNFYKYACEGWIEKHPLPPTETSYAILEVIQEELHTQVNEVLLSPKTQSTKSKAVKNAKNLFQGCIDFESREKEGILPVRKLLNYLGGWPMLDLDGWDDKNYNWTNSVARIIRWFSLDALIELSVEADEKNTDSFIIYLDQPNYPVGANQLLNVTASENTIILIDAYKQFMVKTAQLLGSTSAEDDIQQAADDVIKFESELVKISGFTEDRSDPYYMYNKMSVAELQKMTQDPSVDWTAFLNTVFAGMSSIKNSTEIIVKEVNYFKNMVKLVKKTTSKTLANYIGWKVLYNVVTSSTSALREAHFQFTKVQYGIEQQKMVHKVCADDVTQLFVFAVGRLYIDNYFNEEAKVDVEDIVENLRSAYLQSLSEITWMDPGTKHNAIQKLREMISMMAYPAWIMDDEKLDKYYGNVPDVDSKSYFQSSVNTAIALIERKLKRLNDKNNRTDEQTPPSVANAFYDPSANSVIFPAGILNAPFYQYKRIPTMNYGGIGSVIGHEMSHGFDNQGSQYDKEGNLNNWWTNETREKFEEKARCFKEQYSQFTEPITGMKLNGDNTVGENIADNGAIRNALKAYNLFLKKKGNAVPGRLPGFNTSAIQLFFLSYATAWCGSERKESLRETLEYDEHSPSEYRVLIPLMNMEEFSKAFNCPVGSAMNPPKKCVLW